VPGTPKAGPSWCFHLKHIPASDAESAETIGEPHSSSAASVTSPRLSAAVQADWEALQNDLQQARELAADFQQQLSGQINEHGLLKRLFAKTHKDLVQLQTSIADLREERHRLADQAFEAIALREKLIRLERDNLRLETELEELRSQNYAGAEERSDAQPEGGNASLNNVFRP
jgi:chromosome segregation ATPase